MLTFSKEQIKEISEQLDCGFRAFYHKQSGDLIFVPDTDQHIGMETDAWQDDLDKLDDNPSKYQEISAMENKASFQMMADFAEEVPDTYLRNKLIEALHSNKPFRAFKLMIDNSPVRQNWFAFKNKRYLEWTEEQLKIHEELNRGKNASR